jgi:pectin methylesterase-like acyl-CoA thioesterase
VKVDLTVNATVHIHLHGEGQGQLAETLAIVKSIQSKGTPFMATVQEQLDTISSDLDAIKTNTLAYIASRDAIDVTKDAQIADLTAQLAAGTTTPADVAAKIEAVLAKAEEDKALLASPVPAP